MDRGRPLESYSAPLLGSGCGASAVNITRRLLAPSPSFDGGRTLPAINYGSAPAAPVAAAKVQHSSAQAGQAIILAFTRFRPASMTAATIRLSAMNEIYVISPYKHHGMWVFDDARVGLLQEPFVAGADTWIDRVIA